MTGAAPRPRRRALVLALRLALAALGATALALLVRAAGPDALAAALVPALPYLPVVLALEGARIGCDAISTRLVLRDRGRSVPMPAVYAAQIAAHAVMNVMPAGRSASEAVKAALLSPWLGAAPALAMGYANQANVLVSSGLFSAVCMLGIAVSPDPWTLGIALAIHSAVLVLAGIGMRVLVTNATVAARTARHLPRLWSKLAPFHDASRESAGIAFGPVGAMFASRAVQTVEYAVLAHAVGLTIGPLEALAVQGVNLVGATTGVLVPGQLGSAEAVFALAAEALDTTVARAMSIALLAHAAALPWIALGLGLVVIWRGRRRVGTA